MTETIFSSKFNEHERAYKDCHCFKLIGAIDTNGDIYVCCHKVGQKEFCYGNLITDTIKEIYNKYCNKKSFHN